MPKRVISINLDEEIAEYLKDKAQKEGRSLSNYINEHFRICVLMEEEDEEKGVVEV